MRGFLTRLSEAARTLRGNNGQAADDAGLTAIFIVGVGRSGTHFSARSLAGFERVWDPLNGKEHPVLLRKIAVAAIEHESFPSRAAAYYRDRARSREPGQIFLDQQHPNLFFAHDILKIFPGAVFLFPDRPIAQIVASMIHHPGVLGWYEYARAHKNPTFPNRFLGLSRREEVTSLPLHLLCAKRVIAHLREWQALTLARPATFRTVSYQGLVTAQQAEMHRHFTELERTALGSYASQEEPDTASLLKFRDLLTHRQISEIEALVAAPDPSGR